MYEPLYEFPERRPFIGACRDLGNAPTTEDELRLFRLLTDASGSIDLPENFVPPDPVYLDLGFLA